MKKDCAKKVIIATQIWTCDDEKCKNNIRLSHGRFCKMSPFVEDMHDRCPNKEDCKKQCQEVR
jgi:hypothetical protein